MASGTTDNKPAIYVFSAADRGGDGPAYALAQDGTVLGSHYCSNENYARNDLGEIPGSRPDRHEAYAKHYPGGYQMVFVPSRDLDGHAGFQDAFAANKAKATTA